LVDVAQSRAAFGLALGDALIESAAGRRRRRRRVGGNRAGTAYQDSRYDDQG
jgi:hypothetical protein